MIFNEELMLTRFASAGENKVDDVLDRLVLNLCEKNPYANSRYFLEEAIRSGNFVPGGRVWAMAGTDSPQMMNCFVIGVGNSKDGITEALRQMFHIQALGGGVGYNFSNLSPIGTKNKNGSIASGPCSFIGVFDKLSETIRGAKGRKAANMGILNITHPDIMEFVKTKSLDEKAWNKFNVSIGLNNQHVIDAIKYENWDYKVNDNTRLGDVWNEAMKAQWLVGDPGLINFVNIWNMQNTWYIGKDLITATNPCGEIPLPPNGVCNLGSINLSNMVRMGPDGKPTIDWDKLELTVRAAVVILNRILDTNLYPLPAIKNHSLDVRRIGIGAIGLAHMFIKLGIDYGSDKSITTIEDVYRTIANTAYSESSSLAAKFQSFCDFDADKFLDSGYLKSGVITSENLSEIRKHGILNSHLLTQAPTGATSMLVNASYGMEPIFSVETFRNDTMGEYKLQDPVLESLTDAELEEIPTAMKLSPDQHLAVQIAVQKFVDQSVSKTINMPSDATVDDISIICRKAVLNNLKGITIYRDKSRTTQVLNDGATKTELKTDEPKIRFVRNSPKKLSSNTHIAATPQGKSYITIAFDKNNIDSVFIKCDKVGTDNHAWSNAMGRIISIALQSGCNPEQLAKTLIDCQSSGVTYDSMGEFPQPVAIRSLPDAVGKLLMSYSSNKSVGIIEVENKEEVKGKIEDKTTEKCVICGGPLVPAGGNCSVCTSCGYSPCG